MQDSRPCGDFKDDVVVVVGVGFRFPGRASNVDGLWSVLENAESQWSEFPRDRLNVEGFYHPSRNRQGSIPFRGGHLLAGDVAGFDAPFFSITTDEAQAVDPQQRMLLEVSYEALENAGMRKEALDGTLTSVFVGSFVKDYEQVCLRDPDASPQYAATGNGIALMSNRISYFFNFHGPSETLDTGCSGSLISIHNAVQSLRNGESNLALAGGAGLILTPATMMPMTALNFLSPDGKCFTFDARANGYGRGEGIGVVVLKRLADAIRDNDTIRAVIRGSSKNQDGRTLGITLPSAEAQALNIKTAYANAGLAYDQTAYVECHGTGTQAGDWRELQAISRTISKNREVHAPVFVGSIKPNVGHLEGAAGVAGMIKGILVLERGQIPPQANFMTPNPDIEFENWKVKVPTQMTEWPLPGQRRASINCFGFGGSNAHVILDDAANYLSAQGLSANHNTTAYRNMEGNGTEGDAKGSTNHSTPLARSLTSQETWRFYAFTAPDRAALKRVIASSCNYMEHSTRQTPIERDFLRNYAYTLNCRRSLYDWRYFVLADSVASLTSRLNNVDETSFTRVSKSRALICFVFGGQGAQWPGMGRDLCVFSIFENSIRQASTYMMNHLGCAFDVFEEIRRDAATSNLNKPEISQPATTAIQVALVDLLRSMSILPNYVVGHSSGEIAAAYACGAITRETAWSVAYWRGYHAAAVKKVMPSGEGGMLSVAMSSTEAEIYLQKSQSSVQIACINSPKSTTLSGRLDELQALAQDFAKRKIFNRLLPTGVAYHSDSMKLVSSHYEGRIQDIRAKASGEKVRMFSSVTGGEVSGSELTANYWVQNMISIVQYSKAIESVMGLPTRLQPSIILEITPRAQLRSATLDTMSHHGTGSAPVYHSLMGSQEHGTKTLMRAVASLWGQGIPVDTLAALRMDSAGPMPKCLVDLPTYPWNHKNTYWHESHLSSEYRSRPHGREDLIGSLTADSTPYEPRWRGFLRLHENPWMQDHKVQKTMVYPASGMISMVLEAAKQLAEGHIGIVGYEICDVMFEKALIIPTTTAGIEVSLNLTRRSDGVSSDTRDSFSIYSKSYGGKWQRHASGTLRICLESRDWDGILQAAEAQYAAHAALCNHDIAPRQLYELLDNIGMSYGPLFRNIKEIRKNQNTCVSRVAVPDTRSRMPEKFEYPHLLHPATLDSMIHTLFAIEQTPMVPVYLRSIFVSANIAEDNGEHFHGYSTALRTGLQRVSADITMSRKGTTQAHVIIKGLAVANIASSGAREGGFISNNRNLCTEIVWKKDPGLMKFHNLRDLLDSVSHKWPGLAILQAGGHAETTRAVLEAVISNSYQAPKLARYTIAKSCESDSIDESLRLAKDSLAGPFVEAASLDDVDQNRTYHVVLSTEADSVDEDRLKRHLRDDGILVQLLPGALTRDAKRATVERARLQVYRKPNSSPSAETHNEVVILRPDACGPQLSSLMASLQTMIVEQFEASTVTIRTLEQVANSQDSSRRMVVLSLLDLDAGEPSVYNWTHESFDHFCTLTNTNKRLLWVTKGCHRNPVNPKGAMIVGLLRTLMSEDPLKTYAMIDLGASTALEDLQTTRIIFSVLRATFFSATAQNLTDMEYTEEDGDVYIPRLIPIPKLNNLIDPEAVNIELAKESFYSNGEKHPSFSRLRHEVIPLAISDGGSYFKRVLVESIRENEVEIEFRSAALAKQDADIASGTSSQHYVGLDIRGRITAVGSQVNGFHVGDEVAGLTEHGAVQTFVRLDSRLIKIVPRGFVLSFYLAAYYALSHIGRTRRGQRVLIHQGNSAHGLAAIDVARRLGLDIFTTITGYDYELTGQRYALESVGVLPDHILDASHEGFVMAIESLTDGKGVDVVYNPTGGKEEAFFRCVKRNGYVVQMRGTKNTEKWHIPSLTATLASLDLFSVIQDDLDFTSELLDGVISLIHNTESDFPILQQQTKTFDIADIDQALQEVAKTPSFGYVELRGDPSSTQVVKVMKEPRIKPLSESVSGKGTYLIVGGLLGLGRSIARLLAENGVRYLAFISRSGASSDASMAELTSLRAHGVEARAYSADICESAALQLVIEEIIRDMPPILGIFHCAAVIQDAIFDNMTFADWQKAARPKTVGTWNLVDSVTSAGQDPFFIFLASSTGVIGNRGQANYAAGNAFKDVMAHHLRLQGKHAVSVDLGPVLGAGMLNEDEAVYDMLRTGGFYSISHDDFLTIISHAITGEIVEGVSMPGQVVTGVGTGGLMRQNQPADPYWSRTALYSYLNLIDMPPPDLSSPASASDSLSLRAELGRAPTATAAAEAISLGFRTMLAKAMNMLPEEIDSERPPSAYGVDSLLAMVLRNWVQVNCGVEISLFEVLSEKTVGEMAVMIAERGGFGSAE